VLLTFDDAYESLVTHAVPVLRERGIPALVLPVTDRLGGTNTWDTAHGAIKLRLLSTSQLQAMAAEDWAVGTHGRDHSHLVRLSTPALAEQLAGALDDMRVAQVPILPIVAYPHGEHDVRVRAAARKAGYVAGLALGGGGVERRHSRFALPRIEVTRGTGPRELVALVHQRRSRSARCLERELRWAVRSALALAGLGPQGR
jgi:peptidoglycan/xylan/chitin deacetylase (PgdA/CDA1 family)